MSSAAPSMDLSSAEPQPAAADMPLTLVWLLAASSGLIVANIYYIQPLLPDVAHAFGLTVTCAGAVAMITQLGTACGMFFIVPLGDARERRSLILFMLVLASIFLALVASAMNFPWLCAASFAMGICGSTIHVIVPLAAHLASARERGKVVGSVLSGLLIGILLRARSADLSAPTSAGGQSTGWRPWR